MTAVESQSVFTYGTLMIPETISVISGDLCSGELATLPGYIRYKVRNAPYPVVVTDPEGSVSGYLFRGLSPQGLANLDAYEATIYERVLAAVILENGSKEEAWVYRLCDKYRSSVIEEPWDAAVYLKGRLPEYVQKLRNPRDPKGLNDSR